MPSSPFFDSLTDEQKQAASSKVVSIEEATERARKVRNHPEGRVVWTNGVFDLFHEGHRYAITQCGGRGDYLIVGVNSDASARRLKGEDRPVLSEEQRAICVASREEVDLVVVFDEDYPESTIEAIDPDIVCKGMDYADKEVAGAEGRALFLHEMLPDMSTTAILEGAQNRVNAPSEGADSGQEKGQIQEGSAEAFGAELDRRVFSHVEKELGDGQRPMYAHCFWAGTEFPLTGYISIKSALHVHQPESLIVWTVLEPITNPYWQMLRRDPRIEIRQAAELIPGEVMKGYQRGFDRVWEVLSPYHPMAQAAQIKDLTVWRALHRFGGIFFDLDTISYQPFWEEVEESGKDLMVSGFPATGVLAAPKGSGVCQKIIEWCEERVDKVNPDTQQKWFLWTQFGPTALIAYAEGHGKEDLLGLPSEWFYLLHDHMDDTFADPPPEVDLSEVRMIHFYGEGRNEMDCELDPEELVDEKFVRTSGSIYAQVAREALAGDELLDDSFMMNTLPSGSDQPVGESQILEVEIPHDGKPAEGVNLDEPLITLTVVMKDEKENVREAFGSISDIVDQWIIVDTGSTDGTIEACEKFFEDHGVQQIPEGRPEQFGYRIYHREWKGYMKSRQEALELALEHAGESGYIMKHDMDERMVGGHWLRRVCEQQNPDTVFLYCYEGSRNGVRFGFPRAWHVRTDPHYTGSDHELPAFSTSDPPYYMQPELEDEALECYILHHHGPRNADQIADTCMLKKRDMNLKAAKGARDYRAEFYLARDMSSISPEEAEHWFEFRTTGCEGDWKEERFFTYLYWGDLLRNTGRLEEAVEKWEEARNVYAEARKAREPLDRIGLAYYERADSEEREEKAGSLWEKAADAYEKALPLEDKPDMILFLESGKYTPEKTDHYRWRLAICLWNLDRSRETARRCLDLTEPIENKDARLKGSIDVWRDWIQRAG